MILQPAPAGLDAQVAHDGVIVKFGAPSGHLVLGVLLILAAALASVTVAVFAGILLALATGLLLTAVAVSVFVSAWRAATTVRVTPRQIKVDSAQPFIVRLDDLTEVGCTQNSRGDWVLWVRTRKERLEIVSGRPEHHLKWLRTMIAAAMAQNTEREVVEGREWTFLRAAPKAIDRLRGKE